LAQTLGRAFPFSVPRTRQPRSSSGWFASLIKEWVGHSTLRMTSRYTHFDDSFRQNIANKLGGFTQFTQVVEKRNVSQAS
jgi:hypothetical protein